MHTNLFVTFYQVQVPRCGLSEDVPGHPGPGTGSSSGPSAWHSQALQTRAGTSGKLPLKKGKTLPGGEGWGEKCENQPLIFFFSWVKSVLPVMVLHMWPPCLCLDPQAFFISFFPLSCWEGWAKEQLGGGLAASWCQLTAYMHWNNWASNKLIIYQKASARIPVQIERDQLV